MPLIFSTGADELADLRHAVAEVVGLPEGDTPPDPDPDWRANWDRLCGLGLLALCLPEEIEGGLGGRVDAATAAATTLGAALHGAPFAAAVAAACALAGDHAHADLLADVLSGKQTCGFAAYDGHTARGVLSADSLDALMLVAPDGSLALASGPWTSTPSVHGDFDATRPLTDLAITAATPLGGSAPVGLYRLLLAADALGGVERSLERAVAYAGTRVAFGKAIGGFQAVQQRLVDHTIRHRAMSLAVAAAAAALTEDAAGAERSVLLAEVAVSGHAVRVLHDLLQLTGGIGFTWEHGLHLFERRAHLDATLAGNPRRALADLTATGGMAMSALAEYRAELRRAIAVLEPPALQGEGVRVPENGAEEAHIRLWLRSLYRDGYLGGGWPEEYGGRADHQAAHDLILMEELIRAGAYRPLDQVMLASHALITFGTTAQKDDLLPRIRSGEHIWCQLFSEPDAGSDLASLRTKAVRADDGWIVTGQKVWSTDAQWADRGLLLARTDPDVDRHAGLTAFIVPMDLPGIVVRPIREMTGHDEFCEVFLDGVHLGPEHVLGEVDGGWSVITAGLAGERAFVGANAMLLDRLFADLVSLAGAAVLPDGRRALEADDVRHELGRALAEVEQAKLIVSDTVDRILADAEHPSDGPVAKLAYTELNVALCEFGLRLLSSARSVEPDGRDAADRLRHAFLWSRALTISGGASEILRGLVGRQLLGLPRA